MNYTHIVTAYYKKADGQMEKAGFYAANLTIAPDGVWFTSESAWGGIGRRFIPNHLIVEIHRITEGEN